MSERSPYQLIDASGEPVGYATWDQVSESLSASPEGWIAVDGSLDCYVEGNEAEMRAAFLAWSDSVG
jgi:hypothetical protein